MTTYDDAYAASIGTSTTVSSMSGHRLTFSPRSMPFEYDPSRVAPVANRRRFLRTKPFGGIWLSVDGGWEAWCQSEMPEWVSNGTCEVKLAPDARIYEVHSMADLEPLPKMPDSDEGWYGTGTCPYTYIDFEAMSEEYDGIFLDMSHGPELYFALYGWDCDSVLLFSPKAIRDFGPLTA